MLMDIGYFNQNVDNDKFFEAKIVDTTTRVRCKKIDDNTVFVFAKGKKRYGNYIETAKFLTKAIPIIKSKEELEKEWHSRCKRCEKRLEKSGLWPNLRVLFHNLQRISYDDWVSLRQCERYSETYKGFIVKYPFISKDGTNIEWDYMNTISYATCKSMFFGRGLNESYKRQIKQSLETNQPCSIGPIHLNYDVSFSFKPETKQAWYSEEYRNCGNGHYYLALDESAAVFYEDD